MDDVARELGISKKTLYTYVSNKEELVEKVLEHIHDSHNKNMVCANKVKGLNAIEVLMAVNDMVNKMIQEHNPSTEYDLKKYYPELYKKFLNHRNEHIFSSILQNIQQGKDEGLYRREINNELISKLYVNRINSMTGDDTFTIEELKSSNFFLQVMEFHIRGLATPKGIEILEKELMKYKTN
jgi:TetR/AcrR family transcriptional regulator, cholesterol catabolism regulator